MCLLEFQSGQWCLLRLQACPHQRPSHLFHCPALQLISLSLAGSGSFGGWVVSSSILLSSLPLLLTVGMHSLLSAWALTLLLPDRLVLGANRLFCGLGDARCFSSLLFLRRFLLLEKPAPC